MTIEPQFNSDIVAKWLGIVCIKYFYIRIAA